MRTWHMSLDDGTNVNMETSSAFVWSFLQAACLLEYPLTVRKERIII